MTWRACLKAISIASLIALGACGNNPFVFGCAVFGSKIVPDEGQATRWTVGEKRQVVTHNRKVQRYCR